MRPFDGVLLEILKASGSTEHPWMVFGSCRGRDPDLFFPETSNDAEQAMKICNTCVVKAECFDYSLETRERFGIWGGVTAKQRRHLLRQTA